MKTKSRTFAALRTAEEIATILALAAFWALLLAVVAESQYRYDRVRLVRVVDGDTVRLDIETEPGRLARNKACRLLRMDAPEMGSAGGAEARAALEGFLRGKKLFVEVRGEDRGGRWLIELFVQSRDRDGAVVSENVSDWMVEHAHARTR